MTALVQYRKTDGHILGAWQAITDALLQAQIPPADLATETLTVETDAALYSLVTEYYVEDGEVVPKAPLTFTAIPNPFAADGVTECHITVTPFVPCTVLVNGASYALTAMDPTLVLTADSSQTFLVELATVVAYTAVPVTVEAT